jgi:hypothetical protein
MTPGDPPAPAPAPRPVPPPAAPAVRPPDPTLAARLAAAVAALPRAPGGYGRDVVLGPPSVEALAGGGGPTAVWIEAGEVHALGPRADEVAAQLAGFAVTPPRWLAAWRAATSPGANPWSLGELSRDPAIAARLVQAAARWARPEQARLLAVLARDDAAGRWAMVGDPEPLVSLLAWWATRDVDAAVGWALPLVLERVRRGPLFERAPRPADLALDVLGDAGWAGAVEVRALVLSAPPHGFRAVQPGVVDGGDVVLAIQPVAGPPRRP